MKIKINGNTMNENYISPTPPGFPSPSIPTPTPLDNSNHILLAFGALSVILSIDGYLEAYQQFQTAVRLI